MAKTGVDQTTLYLRSMPRHIVREAKVAAARRGSTLARFVSEALERSLASGATREEPGESELTESAKWFERNRARLLAQFPGEFVAISGNRVLDHDTDFDLLARRIFDRVTDRPVFMPRPVQSTAPLRLRSPRLARK